MPTPTPSRSYLTGGHVGREPRYNDRMVRPTIQSVEHLARQLEPADRRELLQRLATDAGGDHTSQPADVFASIDRLRAGNRLDGLSLRDLIEEGRR